MKRGTDEFGIESICEVGFPVIINNTTGETIKNRTEMKTITEKIKKADRSSIFDILA